MWAGWRRAGAAKCGATNNMQLAMSIVLRSMLAWCAAGNSRDAAAAAACMKLSRLLLTHHHALLYLGGRGLGGGGDGEGGRGLHSRWADQQVG